VRAFFSFFNLEISVIRPPRIVILMTMKLRPLMTIVVSRILLRTISTRCLNLRSGKDTKKNERSIL
jgi:hypothetical protein